MTFHYAGSERSTVRLGGRVSSRLNHLAKRASFLGPTVHADGREQFATELEAMWFAIHLADQHPTIARIGGAWVVSVASSELDASDG